MSDSVPTSVEVLVPSSLIVTGGTVSRLPRWEQPLTAARTAILPTVRTRARTRQPSTTGRGSRWFRSPGLGLRVAGLQGRHVAVDRRVEKRLQARAALLPVGLVGAVEKDPGVQIDQPVVDLVADYGERQFNAAFPPPICRSATTSGA